MTQKETLILGFIAIGLALLIVLTSAIGMTNDFYSVETRNWQVQSIGQDFIDLFLIAPTLLITGLYLTRTHQKGLLILNGILLYIIYTFTIYCFDIHFNSLFLIYCIILGTAFFTFLYFIYKIPGSAKVTFRKRWIQKITGVYLIVIAVLFYMLWLSEILPSVLNNSIPQSLLDAGLPTNPVHVIDLSVFLPGVFVTGVLLLKNKKAGVMMAPVMLTFFILMNITIAALNIIMAYEGLAENLIVAGVMSFPTLVSTVLLLLNFRFIHTEK